MAANTISFIEEQLSIVKDSLLVIENDLERFKRKYPNIENIEQDMRSSKTKIDNLLSEQAVNIKYYSSY